MLHECDPLQPGISHVSSCLAVEPWVRPRSEAQTPWAHQQRRTAMGSRLVWETLYNQSKWTVALLCNFISPNLVLRNVFN